MALTRSEIEALDNSVISAWNFDEGSGTTAFDEKGTNDGSINGATWTTGKIGSALSFDGSNDYVEVPLDLSAVGDFSYSFWVNVDDLGKTSAIIGRDAIGEIARNFQVHTSYQNAGAIEFRIYDGSNKVAVIPASNLSTGIYYHIVTTYNASNGEANIYLNSSLQDTINVDEANTDTATEILFGAWYDGSSLDYFYDGKLDNTKVFDKVLTQEEVDYLYNSGAGRQYPYITQKTRGNVFMFGGSKTPVGSIAQDLNDATISAWNFDEGSGTTAFDEKGSNDGTLVNSPSWVSGKLGEAIETNGNDEYISFGRGYDRFGLGSNFFVGGWFYKGGVDDSLMIDFGFQSSGNAYQNVGFKIKGGTLSLRYITEDPNAGIGGSSRGVWTSTLEIQDGRNFIFGIRTETECAIYLGDESGNLQSENITGSFGTFRWQSGSSSPSEREFMIQASQASYSNSSPDGFYSGTVDGVVTGTVSNIEDAKDWVGYLYNNGNGRQYPY